MDDLRDRMNKLAQRADTAAAPDLEHVRERHARRRRTSALTLGVALTAIVALLAFQVVRADRPAPTPPAATGGGDDAAEILTVWPSADAGTGPWRSSPELVIEEFSYLVLGWSTPDIVAADGGAYELRPEPCPPNARCTYPLTITTVEVSPGVWSIRSVSHPELEIGITLAEPAVALSGGSSVQYHLSLPDDRAGHIGMVASNDCREATAFEIGLDSGAHQLRLPEATPDDPGCDDLGVGYVFAYAMDSTTVPTGDPLREAAAIEYPWLTVIPIHLEMEEPDASSTATPAQSVAETLTVGCGSAGTEVPDPVVAAGPMGVAVEFVDNVDGQWLWLGDGVVVSQRHAVLDLAPGPHEVWCRLANDMSLEPATFEVVDTEGYWVDVADVCMIGGMADFEPVTVPDDDLIAGAMQLLGLDPESDRIAFTYAGYEDSPTERTFVFVEGDQKVGLVRFEANNDGTWTSIDLATCVNP